ncbi:hypothetical protein HMPREF1207_01175 [Paenibacillus sp. HGH0039]|nr:hypothetical protein HMPREF1207_01175 [Paenibacillus sp. HGH0039]
MRIGRRPIGEQVAYAHRQASVGEQAAYAHRQASIGEQAVYAHPAGVHRRTSARTPKKPARHPDSS